MTSKQKQKNICTFILGATFVKSKEHNFVEVYIHFAQISTDFSGF